MTHTPVPRYTYTLLNDASDLRVSVKHEDIADHNVVPNPVFGTYGRVNVAAYYDGKNVVPVSELIGVERVRFSWTNCDNYTIPLYTIKPGII